jgi:uncharacterized protein YcnI
VTTRPRRAVLTVLAVVTAVLTLGIGTASAHVTVSSPDAAPGGFGEITFRVPSESDTARTTSLKVQLPADSPFAFVSVKPVPGWTAATTTTPINPPIEAEGSTLSEAVTEVTWTADAGGGLAPGEYQSFSISAGPLPDTDALSFPALQGYDDGSTVSWIEPSVAGQAEPEHPAPTLALTADGADTAGTAAAPAATGADDDGTSGLAVTALVIGVVGLVTGLAGLLIALATRRRSAATPTAGAPDRDSASV